MVRLVLFALCVSLDLQAMTPKQHCDRPGGELRHSSEKSAEDCAAKCKAESKCLGFSYISGWGRCSLKQSKVKAFGVRIHSAEKREGRMEAVRLDHDHSARDMEKKPRNLASAQECSKACAEQRDCTAFAYIEGYRSCWLKRGAGKFREKLFYCNDGAAR